MLRMGPAGKHLRPCLEDRLARLPEQSRVTVAVELRMFQRPRAHGLNGHGSTDCQGQLMGPRGTRTTTGKSPHKDLNLAVRV